MGKFTVVVQSLEAAFQVLISCTFQSAHRALEYESLRIVKFSHFYLA